MSNVNGRRVIANTNLSLDGRYDGPGAPTDMTWLRPYVVTDTARDHLTDLWKDATTALLGRVNAEGFLGFWPTVIGMEGVDPRDEAFAKWLVEADKTVLSTTLTESPWDRTVIENRPAADVVRDLKAAEGGDILVPTSASVIKALLEADLVDRLALMHFPVVLGGGPILFDRPFPASQWKLVSHKTCELGAIAVVYDRVRS